MKSVPTIAKFRRKVNFLKIKKNFFPKIKKHFFQKSEKNQFIKKNWKKINLSKIVAEKHKKCILCKWCRSNWKMMIFHLKISWWQEKPKQKKNNKTIQNICTHSTAYSYESKPDVFCLLRMWFTIFVKHAFVFVCHHC